jgi:ABC-2 type transport system ATP-binding protein
MVQLDKIEKRYGQRLVLDGVTLGLLPSATYGLWGRNGIGKTTLVRILTGMLLPDAGTVRVLDKDPAADWIVRRQMGIVEDGDTYFPELTAGEFLWWVGRLRHVHDDACREQVDRLASALYIDDRLDDQTGSLSHGMRRKVAIASAFIGWPKLIVMDEPTNGLDVDSVQALCRLLIEHRSQGGTGLLACHDWQFIRNSCSHVVAMDNGHVSEPMTIDEASADSGRQVESVLPNLPTSG